MNILLWSLQVVLAIFAVMGSAWRIFNYEQAAKGIASLQALSKGAWTGIGVFEILCALGLILPGLMKAKPSLTAIAAACLAVEMLLVTGLHARYFGLQPRAANPATWTMALCVLSAFVAWGRCR